MPVACVLIGSGWLALILVDKPWQGRQICSSAAALSALPASPGRGFLHNHVLLSTSTHIYPFLLFFTFVSFISLCEAVCFQLISIFDYHSVASEHIWTNDTLSATIHANAADGQLLSVCTSSRRPTFVQFALKYSSLAKLDSTPIRLDSVLDAVAAHQSIRLPPPALSHLYTLRPLPPPDSAP